MQVDALSFARNLCGWFTCIYVWNGCGSILARPIAEMKSWKADSGIERISRVLPDFMTWYSPAMFDVGNAINSIVEPD